MRRVTLAICGFSGCIALFAHYLRNGKISGKRLLNMNVRSDLPQNFRLRHLSVEKCFSEIHSLTPWSRVLLQKLTGLQLVKKFPAFYGARRFITALTSARHLSLSWASSIQSIPPHPTSWRSILILSSYLRLGLSSGLFPSWFREILW